MTVFLEDIMRICYINPTFLIRRPVSELIDRLGDKDEIGLFVPKKLFKKVDDKWHNDSALRKAKIYPYSALSLPGNFEWPIPITPMFFINLFRVFLRYDVLHMWAYFYINSVFAVLAKLFFPGKRLIMSCDTFPGYSFSSGKLIDSLFFLYSKIFGWFVFSVPDKVHLYGKSMINYARKAGVKKKKIIVIPTGINLDKFKQAKDIRESLGISEDEFVIIYAGLMVPRKGIDVMLKAVRKMDVKLVLAGDGPKKKEYVDMAQRLKLDNVIFLGWRKDIPSLLKSADMLLLPSRGEGLPGIVMEAMASGLAVAASDVGCISDLIKDGENGFLCPVDDVDCFVRKIKKMAGDKEMCAELGKKGYEKIKEFSWEKLISEYKGMYV
ncbi:glycosyltransferase [Candidatus Woesearchaeota archaeon]|nr:glycosyltransferase [Candidatus Woesearchaeota archaeon]